MVSNFISVLLIVCSVINDSNGQREEKFFRADYTYIEATQSFYKIHEIPEAWLEAKRMCTLEGASLFYPENYGEAQAVLALWNKTRDSTQVLIGISALKNKGAFETIDGHPIADVYNNWDIGEPNDVGGSEDCVILRKDGTLNDDRCGALHHFICKKSLASLEWNSECNMPYIGYTYNEQVDRCFKFHPEPKIWREAYAVCKAELSYLPVINNQEVADYLVKLTKNVLDGKCLREKLHFDSIYRDDEGCQDVPGTILDCRCYTSGLFMLSGPSERKSHESCDLVSYITYTKNRIGCKSERVFFCEHKSPPSSRQGRKQPIGKDHNSNRNASVPSVDVMSSFNIFDILLPPI